MSVGFFTRSPPSSSLRSAVATICCRSTWHAVAPVSHVGSQEIEVQPKGRPLRCSGTCRWWSSTCCWQWTGLLKFWSMSRSQRHSKSSRKYKVKWNSKDSTKFASPYKPRQWLLKTYRRTNHSAASCGKHGLLKTDHFSTDILRGDPLYHRWNHHNNMGKFGFEQYKIMKLTSKPRTCLAKIGASIVINKGFFHQTVALIQKLGIQNRTKVYISDCTANYGDIHHEKRQIIHQKNLDLHQW